MLEKSFKVLFGLLWFIKCGKGDGLSKSIFIVTNSAWSGYNFRLSLANHLKKNGFKVSFVVPFDEKYSALLEENFEVFHINFDAKGINPLVDLKTFFSLLALYKKEKPA